MALAMGWNLNEEGASSIMVEQITMMVLQPGLSVFTQPSWGLCVHDGFYGVIMDGS